MAVPRRPRAIRSWCSRTRQVQRLQPLTTGTTAGTGSGTVGSSPAGTSCGSGCLSFAAGTAVTLTATPNTGSTFAGWSGACSGTGNCSVTMNSNQAVTAAFNLIVNPTLTISITSLNTLQTDPVHTPHDYRQRLRPIQLCNFSTSCSGIRRSGDSGACGHRDCKYSWNNGSAIAQPGRRIKWRSRERSGDSA